MPKFSQLITNGSMINGTDWTGSANTTVSNGEIVLTVVGGASSFQNHLINFVDGDQYRITATVNGDSGKAMRFRDHNTDDGGLSGQDAKVFCDGTDLNVEFTWTANATSSRIRIDRSSGGDYTITIKNLVVSKLSPFNDIIKPADVPTPIFNDIIRTYAGEEPWQAK